MYNELSNKYQTFYYSAERCACGHSVVQVMLCVTVAVFANRSIDVHMEQLLRALILCPSIDQTSWETQVILIAPLLRLWHGCGSGVAQWHGSMIMDNQMHAMQVPLSMHICHVATKWLSSPSLATECAEVLSLALKASVKHNHTYSVCDMKWSWFMF